MKNSHLYPISELIDALAGSALFMTAKFKPVGTHGLRVVLDIDVRARPVAPPPPPPEQCGTIEIPVAEINRLLDPVRRRD